MHNPAEPVNSFKDLEQGVNAALETYSNVHRGSGHFSMVTTHLYEHARLIVLDYLKLNKSKYIVIFCTPGGAENLMVKLEPGSYKCVSSQDIGLSLGVRALAVRKKALPSGAPMLTGGGTARLVSYNWVIWDSAPGKFEAGTPAIINIIAFARALCLVSKYGNQIFIDPVVENLTADEILYNDELQKISGSELFDELREKLIGANQIVPTKKGNKTYINFDNSASTLTSTPVWTSVCQTLRQPRQKQQEIIHEVKTICSGFLGAPQADYDFIFTSNTTEAINLAAESLSHGLETGIEPVILTTLLEHTSNDLPWRMVSGFSQIRLNADVEGFLDLKEIETILSDYNQKGLYGKKRIKLMAVSGASNVLGSINDLEKISQVIHKYGAQLLVDGAQLVAHRKIDIKLCNIDYFAFSAHKVYAPFGTGLLVVKKGLLNFRAVELEKIKNSGEENAAGIAALGKTLVLMQRIGMNLIKEKEKSLTRRIIDGMSKINGLTIYGIKDPDNPKFEQKCGVIVFSLKGIMGNRIADELAEGDGIGVRYGCHCAHILIKHLVGVGPGLERFQRIIVNLFPQIRLPGLARVSIGIWNTVEDVDALIEALGEIAGKSRVKSNVMPQINDFIRAATLRVYS